MKYIFPFLYLVLITLYSFSQVPQAFNYQAVARNGSGAILANQTLSVRMTIQTDSIATAIWYYEYFLVTTNQYGLFTLQIGRGTPISGIFSAIPWSAGNIWLKTEIDPAGGTAWINLGSSEFLSVPYALSSLGGGTPLGGWSLTGNVGTLDGTNFIGTTDNVPFNIRINNQKAARIENGSSANTFLGFQAGNANTTGNNNIGIGYQALFSNTTGALNTALGYGSLYYNSSGVANTAFGDLALFFNTTGSLNTAIGSGALYNNSVGTQNTAIGLNALGSNTSGIHNTATGFGSLGFNEIGVNNTATGYYTLYSNTTGAGNNATGHYALRNNTTGNYNTSVGNSALFNNSTGSFNTSIGNNSGTDLGAYNNTTALGYGATTLASDMVRIGNASVTSIGGQVGWTTVSDARKKTNIHPGNLGLDFILKLNPVTYNYTAEGQRDFLYNGFIAQDVEKAAQELGLSFSGVDAPKNENDFYGLRYGDFSVPLVKAIQEQQVQMKKQNDIIHKQNERLEKLENDLKELREKK